MSISIIVVNWNTQILLKKCLKSLYCDATFNSLEIFVVDNASTDGSAEMLRRQFPQVHLIENERNLGFARANNQAICQSSGRYVLLLNPDTEVKPGALETLIKYMDEHSEAGAVGPQILNPDESLQHSCSPTPALSREVLRLFHLPGMRPDGYYPMETWSQNTPREVDVLLGACLMLRREALDKVGLLDEDYYIYSEEVDLCRRLRAVGWKLYWVPKAQIVHHGGKSTQQVDEEMFLNLYQSKLNYFRKHGGKLTVNAYKLVLGMAALLRLVISPLVWFERSSQRQRHLTLAKHYLQLLQNLPGM